MSSNNGSLLRRPGPRDGRWRELAGSLQLHAKLEPPFCIHVQEPHGGAPSRSQPDNLDAAPSKMPCPRVTAGVKQRDYLARVWINAAEVRTLVKIAPVTGEGKIGRIITAVVLASNDVLNMKWNVSRRLRQPTVLARFTGASPDKASNFHIHQGPRCRRTALALAFRIATRSMLSTNSSYSARSAASSWPSFAFVRNSASRVCVFESGSLSAIRRATSGVQQLATGSRKRSRTVDVGGSIMAAV